VNLIIKDIVMPNRALRIGLVLPVLLITWSSFGSNSPSQRLRNYEIKRFTPTFDAKYKREVRSLFYCLAEKERDAEKERHKLFIGDYASLKKEYMNLGNARTPWAFRGGFSVASALMFWLIPSHLKIPNSSTPASIPLAQRICGALAVGLLGGFATKVVAAVGKRLWLLLPCVKENITKQKQTLTTSLTELGQKYPVTEIKKEI
jgi:hypothetical protein